MGTKHDPGEYDCHARAADDEPMFTLLARDPLAPDVIRRWAWEREQARGWSPKVVEALDCARAMEAWADAHARDDG